MPGRKFDAGNGYRYGFNGKEDDKDAGEGIQDYGMRPYEKKICRLISVDPLTPEYPYLTPYQFAENNPIENVDYLGMQGSPATVNVRIPTRPALSQWNVGPEYGKPTLINGPVNAGIYTPQERQITQTEFEQMIPGNAQAVSIDPGGKTATVTGVNGNSWKISLVHKLPAKMTETWMIKAAAKLQEQTAAIFNYSQWNVSIQAYELITTNPETLSDEYLNGVRKRLLNGTATANDRMYANEVAIRQKDGKILPNYENPGHHDPSATNFNKNKSVLPLNHAELFEQSQLGSDGNRWTKVGNGKKAVYHRFQDDGNGNWHWNGSTDAKLKDGTPNKIQEQNVPIEIKRIKNS